MDSCQTLCPLFSLPCCSFSGLLSIPVTTGPRFITSNTRCISKWSSFTYYFQFDRLHKCTVSLNRKTSASRPPPPVNAGALLLPIETNERRPLCRSSQKIDPQPHQKPPLFALTFLTRLLRMASAAKTWSPIAVSSIFLLRALQTAPSRGSSLYNL